MSGTLTGRLAGARRYAGSRLARQRARLADATARAMATRPTTNLRMATLRTLFTSGSAVLTVAGASLAWLAGSGPIHAVGLILFTVGPLALISTLYLTSISTADALLLAANRRPRGRAPRTRQPHPLPTRTRPTSSGTGTGAAPDPTDR